mmetsp:Transcript_27934/g.59146  ORF Transcript_27934/g.59146 Transcript_27934/m.59146 type:complete len:292 (-) Transcript_27934:40-915(-)
MGKKSKNILPGIGRIILVRHGESLGNVDEQAYVTTADWRIPLTDRGREQARRAGRKVASHLSCMAGMREDGSVGGKGKIFFYVSPYLRTRQTLREMLREVDSDCVVGIREDPRISEQQFGNFQSHHAIQESKAERSDFGRFYYRFPDGGESGFDVYDRVSGFIGTLQRDVMDLNTVNNLDDRMTICLVTHGLTLRLFLMRWFQYTVHEFERSFNPDNGRVVILDLKTARRNCCATNGSVGENSSIEEACNEEYSYFELSEHDRMAMGFPLFHEQERFQLLHNYCLLNKNEW